MSLEILRSKWLAALLLAIFFGVGCSEKQPSTQMQQHSGVTMGTTFSVKWFSEKIDPQIKSNIDKRLVDINQIMSTYIPNSELSLINKSKPGIRHAISPDLKRVLSISDKIYNSSAGKFDPTVGPLVNLWGFGPDGRVLQQPEESKINDALSTVGFNEVHLGDDGSLTLNKPRYIDLSAVAKGDAVDQISQLLISMGVEVFMVEIGGEIKTNGVKPNGQFWRLAIESPSLISRSVQKIVNLKDKAIATSGDYRNYFEDNGVRFSHTIDPSTGRPISHRLASVSVIADSCAEADALATAFMVMGTELAYQYSLDHQIDALFISHTDDGFVEKETPNFNKYTEIVEK